MCISPSAPFCLSGSPRVSVYIDLVQILQSHFSHTMSHWSGGLPVCFPSQGTRVENSWGALYETGTLSISFFSLCFYIYDIPIRGSAPPPPPSVLSLIPLSKSLSPFLSLSHSPRLSAVSPCSFIKFLLASYYLFLFYFINDKSHEENVRRHRVAFLGRGAGERFQQGYLAAGERKIKGISPLPPIKV